LFFVFNVIFNLSFVIHMIMMFGYLKFHFCYGIQIGTKLKTDVEVNFGSVIKSTLLNYIFVDHLLVVSKKIFVIIVNHNLTEVAKPCD